jgi:hypothetical protein
MDKKMRPILLLSLILLFGSSGFTAEPQSAFDTPDVSLISLIAIPEKFDGKYIRISGVGYFDSKGAVAAVFLTREDKLNGNTKDAIFLYLKESLKNTDRFNNKFVVAQGVFRAADRGHLNFFSASLADVDRVSEITSTVK